MTIPLQRTISSKVNCNGIGLHSGVDVKMSLLPAPIDSGIVFIRTDIDVQKGTIRADYKNVIAAIKCSIVPILDPYSLAMVVPRLASITFL
jgi:UDP-3-O-[3-hydroxymyristoyl] N-acetylglucosamine deacetylase